MIIQAVEAGERSGGRNFPAIEFAVVRNLPIWHFQMLTGMLSIYKAYVKGVVVLDAYLSSCHRTAPGAIRRFALLLSR